MQTIKQGGLSTLGSPAFLKENQGLAALFPSLLTVDGPKLPTSASVAAELSQALSTALSLTDAMPDSTTSHLSEGSAAAIHPSTEVSFTQQKDIKYSASAKARTDKISLSEHVISATSDNGANKIAGSTAKKSNAEINALLQQHYCSHKNKKKLPSASAIRKGKVPMPPSCVVDDGDSTDELSEDSSSLPPDDTCSSASSITSQLGGHGSTNGKACTCCYCEVFGHNSGVGGGQTVAPVSRNYPEMRERLRLLLSKKKKKEQTHCKQQLHPQQQQQQHQKSTKGVAQQLQPSGSNSGSSSVTSSTSSVKSTAPNGNSVKKEVIQNVAPTLSTAPPAAKKPTPQPASTVVPTTKPALPVNKASTPKPVAVQAVTANAQARSQSATSLAPSVPPPPLKLEKSRSAVAPKAAVEGADKPSEKDLELLLEFIEGSAASANEKRKAKKERQKQQKLEEIRARKLEERRKQEAEEAEARRRQEEEHRRLEMQLQMLKKAKKKAAQRAKKATANGVRIEDLVDTEEESVKVSEKVPVSKIGLEDLRARQMRELQELQARHQKQMEEEQSKLVETKQQQQQQQLSKKSNKKAGKKGKEGSVPPSNSNTVLNDVAKAGPGTQIKITRTASGGVEFTTIPADGVPPKKIPVEASPVAASPVPHNVLFNQFQMNPYSPQLLQQQQTQPPAFMPSQQPSPDRPSVPSKMTPSQPMVTIRRIENPGLSEPTVTISTQGGAKESSKKLLYTLINGQVNNYWGKLIVVKKLLG